MTKGTDIMTHEVKHRADEVTGVSNVAYNAVTVLSNLLQGATALEQYKMDAKEAGDDEAVKLFERVQRYQLEGVQELKRFVSQKLS
jgi:hypothetical protein